MTRIVLRPAARRDVLLQVAYYLDEDTVDAARRFPWAVEEGFQQFQERPADLEYHPKRAAIYLGLGVAALSFLGLLAIREKAGGCAACVWPWWSGVGTERQVSAATVL